MMMLQNLFHVKQETHISQKNKRLQGYKLTQQIILIIMIIMIYYDNSFQRKIKLLR